MEHPEEPTMYYPPSLPLSPSEHHNVSMDNDFQAGLPSTRGVGTTYGTTSMVYRGQYIAPVVPPEPVPPPSNRMAETPVPLPHVKSPMAHLPYPEDIAAAAAAAAANTGDDKPQHSLPEGQQQSPFPMSTVAPLSPVVLAPALTFIQYPGTETRSHYDGHAGGRGVESDDLAENDEPHSSPSSQRRGRRGKKQPKKDVFLGCSFCRERKIACHPKNDGGKGRACSACAKRRFPCQYPLTSYRGQYKTQNPVNAAAGTSCSPARATSKARAQASSMVTRVA